MDSNVIVGYGKSFGSFGEIVQGRLSNETDFLVTIPIDLWSICTLICIKRPGPLVVNCDYQKSKQVSLMIFNKLNIKSGFEIYISFNRNIPIGKGLSSSTADMLSTIRAFQEIFGFLLRPSTVSKIFNKIEPHDGLMYKSCVIYDHRKGNLILDLDYIPNYKILGIDLGGVVDTMTFNSKIDYSDSLRKEYDELFSSLKSSFEEKDDFKIADSATRSTIQFLKQQPNKLKDEIVNLYKEFNSLGVINTHSGTCLGFLYPSTIEDELIAKYSSEIQRLISRPVFVTRTLNLIKF
jgi:uncharacterized protein involved in propanediol utilization